MTLSKSVLGASVLVAGAALAFFSMPPVQWGNNATRGNGAAGPKTSRAVKAASAVEAAPPAAGAAEAVAPASPFRDQRPIEAGVKAVNAASVLAAKGFDDTRPLSKPSFRDVRTIEGPTFRDGRDVDPQSFRDTRPIAPPSDTPTSRADQRPAAPTGLFQDFRPIEATTVAGTPSGTAADTGLNKMAAAGTVTTAPVVPPASRANCAETEVTGTPLGGGMMSLRVHAGCLVHQTVRIHYGGAELVRTLDVSGNLELTLDCFAGSAAPVEVRFPDGTRKSIPAVTYELEGVSKVAVIWRAPVNLDLHVFEYAARFGQPGHRWAKSPSSLNATKALLSKEHKGRGFISSIDGDDNSGDKIEVYTFFHDDEQTSGAIGLALDYESRGDQPNGAMCGTGELAEVDFKVVVLPRGGTAARQSGVLTHVDCGTKLTAEARFGQSALPGLRIRK